MSTPLTEGWLRSAGFKWDQADRQPHKHWTLWIGQALPNLSDGFPSSADDLGIEVSMGNAEGSWWFFWLRADLAGRYSRFIHARQLATVEQLTGFIEAMTDRPWDPANVLYGQYWTPEAAARLRRDAERMDWRIARMRAEAEERREGEAWAQKQS